MNIKGILPVPEKKSTMIEIKRTVVIICELCGEILKTNVPWYKLNYQKLARDKAQDKGWLTLNRKQIEEYFADSFSGDLNLAILDVCPTCKIEKRLK